MKIKLLSVIFLVIGFCGILSAAENQIRKVVLSDTPTETKLLSNHKDGFDIEFKVGTLQIEEVKTKGGVFDEIRLQDYGFSSRTGEPKLPVFSRIIAVPVGASVSFDVISRKQKVFSQKDSGLLHRLIPAQRSISKSEDPDKVPFELNNALYQRDALTANELFTVTEIGFMRGVRVFQMEYEPVQYNPLSGELKVNYEVQIRVSYDNPDFAATEALRARTASYEFDRMYGSVIYNWRNDYRPPVTNYPTKMLILCPPAYTTALQTFVDWKIQQGFNVIVTTVGTGGTVANTTTAINTYMAGVWSAATPENPAPTYLLIVGDTSTSGNNIIANTGAAGSHVTDLTYVRLEGGDYIPEMYYGRFSVSSETELNNIINKTIMFEKTLMPDLSYLGNVVMIAGVDATYAPNWGNGQINYGTTHYFNATNGTTSNTYLYPESGSSDATIIANANAGRGYMNYTAHGSETSWADPTFTVSDVNAMTNTNKFGVMVGNCCVTNAFGTGVCFGESIIRKANAGGVIYIGATNNSYWDEDYWWGIGYKTPIQAAAHAYSASTLGAYDTMFHTHGEAFSNWAQTVGEINFKGNSAVQQSTSSRKNYYWEIYSIMGDPSLMPYLGVPTTNTATYPVQILLGVTSINITAAPYSRVALTRGGTIYGTALVPSNGSLVLPITAFTTVGTAKLVITAQNKQTIIADVEIIPNSGPFVSVSSVNYADSNNNTPEYNESGRFNVTFQNVGSDTATNVTATLTCSTAGITLTDNTEIIASLGAGASTTVNNAYTFNIANNVANNTSADFTITMVSGVNTWIHNFSIIINAPQLSFGNITIQDPTGNNNGRLDPGETVTVSIPLNNTGGAASVAGTATLTSPTSGITINTGTANFTAITASGSTALTFNLTAAAGMSIGTVASLVFNATAGAYTANKTATTTVGIILEDFESGNFNAFPWTFSGNANWTIDNTNSQTGTYSSKSGTISDSQTTTMQTTRILSASGTLSFWYKVSSESGYDYLKFYVDGVQQNSPGWAGTIDWTQATYTLSAGTRTLKWEYFKDGSLSSGSDCVWVDNIIFPASTAPSVYNPAQNLIGIPGNGNVNLNWQAPASGIPTGYKIYRNSSLLTTVTGLTYNDTSVVNETTYTYYVIAVHTGGDSDPSNTITVTPSVTPIISVILGSGTLTTGTSAASPINIYYKSLHGQSVYTAAELNALGLSGQYNITQVGFYISSVPSLALPNFIIRMKHTTDTNVANWQTSTGMTTVYSNASYMPVAGGYEMLTLSSPFLWNGIDNIVIDTAFGLLGSYTSTGTVQYTTLTNGYRFIRSDTVDETSVFTGGETSTNRPNLKLTVAALVTAPVFNLTPSSLSYGNIVVNATSVRQFTLQNTGNAVMTGSITTPQGYSVATSRSDETVKLLQLEPSKRNVLNYTIPANQSQIFNLAFAPTAAQSYNGNVVITSNDENNSSVNLTVTGTGYIPVFNPPSALNAVGYHTGVYLSWTAPTGSSGTLTGYKVYRDAVLLTPSVITATNYTDTGLTNGTSYQYYVKAFYINPAGESANSITVNAIPAPLQPQNLVGFDGNNQVTISWQVPLYGSPSQYKIFKNSQLLTSVTQMTYIDYGVVNGTTYNYYVKAVYSNPAAESEASNTVYTTPTDNIIYTIATGTVTELGLPIEPFQGFTYSQSIYLQSEINQQNKTFNKLFWYYGGGSVFTDAIAVYLGHTNLNEFPTNSSWIPVSGMTLVYNGNLTTPASAGWIEIPLSTHFVYNNTQNLVIACDENTSGRHLDTDEFHCMNTNGNRSIVFTSLATNANPESPPTSGTNLRLRSAVPSLKLSMIDSAPPLLLTTPDELSFGSVIIGQNATRSLTIQNVSDGAISATISTPAGYSIAQSAREASRNSVNLNLNAGQSLVYNVTFSPVAVNTYNGNITIVCNNQSNSTYQVTVSGEGYATPTAILNTNELESTLSSSETEIQQFSICNTGSQPLNFSIDIDTNQSWLRCEPMSGTVAPSSCYSVSVEFNAVGQQAGSYYMDIVFNSNDPNLSRQVIEATLFVYHINHPPVINLPVSFSFNKNETLVTNFGQYISDANNDNLSLIYQAGRNLNVSVEGHIVTFSAAYNWYGTEVVTFAVNDGQATTSDSVTINVLPTDLPTWLPTVYSNNPATVFGIITINGTPADTGDQIAAFVGDECRGTGSIVINQGQAYTTLLVNLSAASESVIFKVYDASADLIYQTTSPQVLSYGQVLGDIIPHPISVSALVSLDPPVVTVEKVTQGIKLSWLPVANATRYRVFRSNNPVNGYSEIAVVTGTQHIDTQYHDCCFYKVYASDGTLNRGGVR